VQQVPRRELEGVDAELRQEIGARLVERSRDEGGAFLVRVPAELEPVALRELESLTMLAVRRAEAVLVVVRRLVERTGEETTVVALLELDRIDAALARRVDERLRLLEVALVVVPDLGDDVRGAVPRYHPPVDDQLAHGAMVLGAAYCDRRQDRRIASPVERCSSSSSVSARPRSEPRFSPACCDREASSRSSWRRTSSSGPSFSSCAPPSRSGRGSNAGRCWPACSRSREQRRSCGRSSEGRVRLRSSRRPVERDSPRRIRWSQCSSSSGDWRSRTRSSSPSRPHRTTVTRSSTRSPGQPS